VGIRQNSPPSGWRGGKKRGCSPKTKRSQQGRKARKKKSPFVELREKRAASLSFFKKDSDGKRAKPMPYDAGRGRGGGEALHFLLRPLLFLRGKVENKGGKIKV